MFIFLDEVSVSYNTGYIILTVFVDSKFFAVVVVLAVIKI
jgi:hypothetical protein